MKFDYGWSRGVIWSGPTSNRTSFGQNSGRESRTTWSDATCRAQEIKLWWKWVSENIYDTRTTMKQWFWNVDRIQMMTWMLLNLKEKLPQAFMQIEWMENDFRNLTAKVWANLDNPIKIYDFSKFWLISCMPPTQVALW